MCRCFGCANMQICKCADVIPILFNTCSNHLHIRYTHIQQIFTLIKKALSYNTRRLLNIFQIRLVTFTSINRILNVVVMYDYFFK
jgi:hypothetical protein